MLLSIEENLLSTFFNCSYQEDLYLSEFSFFRKIFLRKKVLLLNLIALIEDK
jgi:hypothetical protein